LKDHSDGAPEQCPPLGGAQGEDIAPAEADHAPPYARAARQDADGRLADHCLAATRLAHEPVDAPRVDAQIHAAHDECIPDCDIEPFDIENWAR
jgi:hypothetical protein